MKCELQCHVDPHPCGISRCVASWTFDHCSGYIKLDHLLAGQRGNHLPFAEDLRVAKFMAFDEKTEYLPSEEQLDAMSELVRSLDLCSGRTASSMHQGH